MAVCNSISAEAADELCIRLEEVANNLRAMRQLAMNSESVDEFEALRVAIPSIAEYSHLILDSCVASMGNVGLGNFRDKVNFTEHSGAESN